MKGTIFAASFFVLTIQHLWLTPHKLPQAISNSDKVCWESSRKLSWSDFQATAEPALKAFERLKSSEYLGAVSDVEAVIYDCVDEKGHQYVSVTAEFHKSTSWVTTRPGFEKSYGLAHEQLHFDIAELSARKMRRALAKFQATGGNLSSQAKLNLVNQLYVEEDKLQARYDDETGCGKDVVKQGWWTGQVGQWLRQLNKYQSTRADCMAR